MGDGVILCGYREPNAVHLNGAGGTVFSLDAERMRYGVTMAVDQARLAIRPEHVTAGFHVKQHVAFRGLHPTSPDAGRCGIVCALPQGLGLAGGPSIYSYLVAIPTSSPGGSRLVWARAADLEPAPGVCGRGCAGLDPAAMHLPSNKPNPPPGPVPPPLPLVRWGDACFDRCSDGDDELLQRPPQCGLCDGPSRAPAPPLCSPLCPHSRTRFGCDRLTRLGPGAVEAVMYFRQWVRALKLLLQYKRQGEDLTAEARFTASHTVALCMSCLSAFVVHRQCLAGRPAARCAMCEASAVWVDLETADLGMGVVPEQEGQPWRDYWPPEASQGGHPTMIMQCGRCTAPTLRWAGGRVDDFCRC